MHKRENTNTQRGELSVNAEVHDVLGAWPTETTLDAMLEIFHHLMLFQLFHLLANLP